MFAAANRMAMATQLEAIQDNLFFAVRDDDIPRIRELIRSGADVNAAHNRTGYTPLMWVQSVPATKALIDAGAKVDARDRRGHTPLMWVISKNKVPIDAAQIAAEIIDAGADVEARDDDGKTAQDWARRHRCRLRELRDQRMAEQLVTYLQTETGGSAG